MKYKNSMVFLVLLMCFSNIVNAKNKKENIYETEEIQKLSKSTLNFITTELLKKNLINLTVAECLMPLTKNSNYVKERLSLVSTQANDEETHSVTLLNDYLKSSTGRVFLNAFEAAANDKLNNETHNYNQEILSQVPMSQQQKLALNVFLNQFASVKNISNLTNKYLKKETGACSQIILK